MKNLDKIEKKAMKKNIVKKQEKIEKMFLYEELKNYRIKGVK